MTTATAAPVVTRSAEQRKAEQQLADALTRVETADRDAAAADASRDELLDRLRAGDTTVTASHLAEADAACRRGELLSVAARDQVPVARDAIRSADLAAAVAEAGAYARSGASKQVAIAIKEATRAKATADAATAAYTRRVIELGSKLRSLGAPRVPPGDARPGWVGTDMSVQGFSVGPAGYGTDWQDHRNGGAQ